VEGPVKEIIIAQQIPFVLLVVWVFALVQVYVEVTVTLMTKYIYGVITPIALLVIELLTVVYLLVVLLVL